MSSTNRDEAKTEGACCKATPTSITLNVIQNPPQQNNAPATARFFCPCCPGVENDEPEDCPICGMPLQENPAFQLTELVYTCPMHPDVVAQEPGACSICGMDLEARDLRQAATDDMGLRGMQVRLAWTIALVIPLVVLAMGPMLGLPLHTILTTTANHVLQAILCSLILVAGWPLWVRGWDSIRNRNPNMFTLILIGTGTAYGFSLMVTLFPHMIPSWATGGDHAVYFEAAGVIVSLVLLGQVLEIKARSRVHAAIRELMELRPPTAIRLAGTDESEVATSQLMVGDRIKIYPGQKVPVDATLESAETYLNESMVTGEPLAVKRVAGDEIIGGTINETAAVVARVSRVGQATYLSRIISMVAAAQRSRAPIQQLADRVASWFVPAVLAVAVLTCIAWLVFGDASVKVSGALVASVSVLLIACPCAVGLATPISLMVGVGRAAKQGILVRNGEALQALATIDVLMLDKTGTLTEGEPRVTHVECGGGNADSFLAAVASLESFSEHPLARAVIAEANRLQLTWDDAQDVEVKAGYGVVGRVDGVEWLVGKPGLLERERVKLPTESQAAFEASDSSLILVAVGGEFRGWIAVEDALRPDAKIAIDELKRLGIEPVMLTGDREVIANRVADAVGINDVHFNMSPEGKQLIVEQYRKSGRTVGMVGDGVNDAPSLASASVGIAMGTGTDVAMETADVTLASSDLLRLVDAILLSRSVIRNIKQNLWFAFGYNAAGVPVAAGVLYPWFGILLSPMIAAALMSLSSVSVISNALRLRRMKLSGR